MLNIKLNDFKLTEDELVQISHLTAKKIGLYYPPEKYKELEIGIARIMRDLGMHSTVETLQRMLISPRSGSEIEIFTKHLTNGETYFIREPERFAALEKIILPELIEQRKNNTRTIKIWSAGCSSGEEPYSIAILLHKLIPDIKNWNIKIMATDINQESLKKARAGRYGNWSFRGTPEWIKSNYFKNVGHEIFEIDEKIREMVHFSFLNLVDGHYPSAANETRNVDILFCRHVLMYFNTSTIKKIVNRFSKCLASQGLFMVALVESGMLNNSPFTQVKIGGTYFYRRTKSTEKSSMEMQVIDYEFRLPEELLFPPIDTAMRFRILQDMEPSSVEDNNIPAVFGESGKGLFEDVAVNIAETASDDEDIFLQFEALDYKKTIEILTAVDISKNSEKMILLARAYANQGELDAAAEWSGKAVDLDKSNKEYHLYHGKILQELGKIKEAVSCYERVLYLDHDYVIVHFTLALLLRLESENQKSKRHFKTASKILGRYKDEEVIEGSEGISAGQLREIILSLTTEVVYN